MGDTFLNTHQEIEKRENNKIIVPHLLNIALRYLLARCMSISRLQRFSQWKSVANDKVEKKKVCPFTDANDSMKGSLNYVRN